MKKLPFLVITLLLSIFSFGQSDDVIRCNTDELHAQKMEDPVFRAAFEAKVAKAKKYMDDHADTKLPDCAAPLIIPVAVHFQGMGAGFDMTCALDMALDQVNRMNLDFAGTNTDINLWEAAQTSTFPGINNRESCIQFCLATLNHPAGFGLNEGDYAVTINETTGDNDAAWSGYLNFWVRTLGGGILGYSPLGGNGNGDGVACTISSFGATSCGGITVSPPYHLGRTMTHEVGHYLLLDHTFNGGCTNDDSVADTPATDAPSYGCPNLGDVSCTAPILWMSYMDYCDDLCLYMFSEGQIDRMESYVNSSLQILLNNSVTVCQEAACVGYQVNTMHSDESCSGNDGEINLNVAAGSAPYSYSINNGATFLSTSDFTGLPEGVYDIIVRDDADCEYIEEITLVRDPADFSLISKSNTFCGSLNGTITVEVNEPSVFEFSVDNINWHPSPVFEGLTYGTYDVVARNSVGCEGHVIVEIEDENNLEVVVDERKNVNCFHLDNGEIDFHVKGSQEPITYTLDGINTSGKPSFNDLSVGPHNIHVMDNIGCQTTFEFDISTSYSLMGDDCPCYIFVPNALTPNNDDVNDFLWLKPSCPNVNFNLQIFDKWGAIVYQTNSLDLPWDGGGHGDDYYLIDGLYYYKISYAWGFPQDQTPERVQTGYITVIR